MGPLNLAYFYPGLVPVFFRSLGVGSEALKPRVGDAVSWCVVDLDFSVLFPVQTIPWVFRRSAAVLPFLVRRTGVWVGAQRPQTARRTRRGPSVRNTAREACLDGRQTDCSAC